MRTYFRGRRLCHSVSRQICDLGCNRFADFRRLDLSELLESRVPTVLVRWIEQSSQGNAAIEPRLEVQARYVAEVDEGTRGSVWTAGGCLSWYTDATGRNSALWPGSVRAYQRRLARFDAADYLSGDPRRDPARREAEPVSELV